MRKSRAFLLHLGASAAIAGAALLVFVRLWYPLPYFVADGGWQGLRLVVLVDVVLGPLLTLVVYRKTKPRRELFFDYACIGAVQVAALLLGLWTIYGQRTEVVVFADGRFYTVDAGTAEAFGPRGRALLAGTTERPMYAAIRMPEDEAACQELRRETLRSGCPLYLRDELLEPLDRRVIERLAAESPWVPSPEEEPVAQRLRAMVRNRAENFVLFPATCRYRNVALLLDVDSARTLEWMLLPPSPPRRQIRVSGGDAAPRR